MREIIFRGKGDKRYNDGYWVYGVPVQHTDGDWQIHWGCSNGGGYSTVLPETIGECTGLNDKNGNRIFEGDILKVRQLNSEDFEIAKICFGEFIEDKLHYLGFYAECKDGTKLSLIGGKSIVCHLESFFEVIGNIYDNPDFLEESNG